MVKRGTSPRTARLRTMAIALALAPLGAIIATQPPLTVTFAIAATVAFAHLVFQVNVSTLIVDIYPQRMVATVFGVIAAGSGLGGLLSTQVVGILVSQANYAQIFILMAFLHPLAWLFAWLAVRGARSRYPEPFENLNAAGSMKAA